MFLYWMMSDYAPNEMLAVRPASTLAAEMSKEWPFKERKEFCAEHGLFFTEKGDICFTRSNIKKLIVLLSNKNDLYFERAKACYGVNPRVADEEGRIVKSGINAIVRIHCIQFDCDFDKDVNIDEKNFAQSQDDIDGMVKMMLAFFERKYGLKNPTIVSSGKGRHILYRIKPIENNEERREWLRSVLYKDAIKQSKTWSRLFTTRPSIDDKAKDIARILQLPQVMNPKRKTLATVLTQSDYVNDFKINKMKVEKYKFDGVIEKNTKLSQYLVYNILTRVDKHGEAAPGPIDDLRFVMKVLLKSHFPSEWPTVQMQVNQIREHKDSVFNIVYIKDGFVYNKGLLVSRLRKYLEEDANDKIRWLNEVIPDWRDEKWM